MTLSRVSASDHAAYRVFECATVVAGTNHNNGNPVRRNVRWPVTSAALRGAATRYISTVVGVKVDQGVLCNGKYGEPAEMNRPRVRDSSDSETFAGGWFLQDGETESSTGGTSPQYW